MKNNFLGNFKFAVLGTVLLLGSCKKDNNYQVPTTYSFDNVNYSEQTSRLSMLTELVTYSQTANVLNAAALDAAKMKNMFSNSNSPFTDTALNNSSLQLKDKTVSSEQLFFEKLMDSLALVSTFSNNNSPVNGNAGILTNIANTKSYLINANGVELSAIIEKGLMGALLYYQATAVYLGTAQMNVDNITVVPGQGTAMEHSWDEAFGYFGVATDFPGNLSGIKFWGKSCNERESKMGLNSTIMNAFKAGRAAISNEDLGERDVQITIIRRKWELIIAATAVSYLNRSIAAFSTDAAEKHHALSEGFGAVYSLKWGGDPTISTSTADAVLTSLGGSSNPLQINFYNTTLSQIQAAKDAIVAAFPSLGTVKDNL
jgi:hypothetical protein